MPVQIDTPITASAATLDRTINSNLPVIVVLYNHTLPTDLESAMKNLAKSEAEKLLVVKVDAAENQELSVRYQLGLPALIAFKEGKEVARTDNPQNLQNYANYLLGKTSELKHAKTTITKPMAVTDSTFADQVLKSDKPVLVDFWATWCGPCHMIAPTLEKLAGEYAGKVTIAKLDVDQNPQISNLFRVQSIPTLILFKNGQPIDKAVGALPESALRNLIQKHL